MVKTLGIKAIRSAPRAAMAGRLCRTSDRIAPSGIQRPCHSFGRRHLVRALCEYVGHCNDARPHQSLNQDPSMSRGVEPVVEICVQPVLGGLHHRYFRAA